MNRRTQSTRFPSNQTSGEPARAGRGSARLAKMFSAIGRVAIGLGVLYAILVAVAALVVRRQPRKVLDVVRQFNRGILNPFMLRLAARGPTYFAVVHHVGRRTGREYATPVVIAPIADGLIIPLPYGTDVDWLRNVLAVERFTVDKNGVEYTVGQPAIVDKSVTATLLPARERLAFELFGIRHFLRVTRLPGATTEPRSPRSSLTQ